MRMSVDRTCSRVYKEVDCNSFIHLITILLSIHYESDRVLNPGDTIISGIDLTPYFCIRVLWGNNRWVFIGYISLSTYSHPSISLVHLYITFSLPFCSIETFNGLDNVHTPWWDDFLNSAQQSKC